MNKKISALEAKSIAQEIAFSPMVFQATRCLLKFGVLNALGKNKKGLSIAELHQQTNVSKYGLGVLLEMAFLANIVQRPQEDFYLLDKVGYFLLSDPMTKVNFNFVNDVCYQGLFDLDEAIQEEKPAGLKYLGDWDTIYQGLSILPEPAKTSWFEFDHFYSDGSFDEALEFVFRYKPKHVLDVGGNTGKWSMKCCHYDDDVQMSILDLPGQLKMAEQNLIENNLTDRVNLVPTNVLAPDLLFPKADAIWMSQFLDCFSEQQVINILSHVAKNMDENTNLFIMETFWDNQKHDAAKFSLAATSLYFTAMANGNSKMYGVAPFKKLIEKAGLRVVEESGMVGISHTILRCQKA